MKIRLLPDASINLLAAGEVVERPASIVKELVENAIDAGSTEIQVTFERGGLGLVQVVDNGCGMERDDALLSFERHATSKISHANDLMTLATMGFRGEALASIAAVSRILMRTRCAQQSLGTEVRLRGGAIENVSAVVCPIGTQISVSHLFATIPARKKFLRSERYEGARIKSIIRQLALSNHHILFRIMEGNKDVQIIPRHASFLDRVHSLFSGNVVVVHSREGQNRGWGIEGVIAHPSEAESTVEGLVLIVNGRVVQDRLLLRAVREGFAGMLKGNEIPSGVIGVWLPPAELDVNVHPQKSQVRFRNSQMVSLLVRDSIAEAVRKLNAPLGAPDYLQASNLATSIHGTKPDSPTATSPAAFSMARNESAANYDNDTVAENFSGVREERANLNLLTGSSEVRGSVAVEKGGSTGKNISQFFPDHESYRSLRYLGQVAACYLLFESPEGLVVMDMHAAHERVNYFRIKNKLQENSRVDRQPLLIPLEVPLAEEAVEILRERSELLETVGISLSFSAEGSRVSIVSEPLLPLNPGFLGREDLRACVRDVASEDFLADQQMLGIDLLCSRIARRACHASIRAGDRLQPEHVQQLCSALDEVDTANACPHGRPITIKFGVSAIERWFGRDR